MRHQDNHQQPERVLQQPPVDQHLRRVFVEYFVVHVEQSEPPQVEHRQPHVHAEQIVQRVGRLTDQPVFDPEYLHHVGHRVALDQWRVKISVVPHELFRRTSSSCNLRRRCGRRLERVLGAVHVLLVQPSQLTIDLAKLDVHLETLRDELRLHAAHAQVLDVQEQEVNELRGVGVVRVQVVQPSHGDRHGHGQAQRDHGGREPLVEPEFRGGRRRVQLKR